ncbi:MAG: multiheme c-type cytochrome [Planctomycetota bacterium]
MKNAPSFRRWAVLLAAAFLLAGCKDGDPGPQGETGAQGPAGPAGPAGNTHPLATTIGLAEDLPGFNCTIIRITGASGPNFQVGDSMSVTFTIETDNGHPIPLDEVDSARMWLAGPTTLYQKVTGNFSDIASGSVQNPDGSWTYTLPVPIPATYPLQYNETGHFPENQGLSGQALRSGTYTLCMRAYKFYWDPKGTRHRDVGNVTHDFLLGTATTLEHRTVVSDAACNSCHGTLQMHGGSYRTVKLCITCHTVGAESNTSNPARGPKKEILDFGTMIHKVHNAAHLPSVNGVTVDAAGNRDYTSLPPQPYMIGGHNFVEEVHFPVFPTGMPQDRGYDDLSGDAEDQEDAILDGVTACAKCHVDPDGSGPMTLADNNAFTNPNRRACGSCHDDIKWDQRYISNSGGMDAQADDTECLDCHAGTAPGDPLGIQQAHIHPIHDSTLNTGVVFTITAVGEDPADPNANQDGTIDVGEKLRVTLNIKDDFGNEVAPATIGRWEVLVGGPTENPQLFQRKYMPVDLLGAGAPSYTFNVPEFWTLSFVGKYSGENGDTFPETTIRAPFYTASNTTWAPDIEVYEVVDSDDGSVLAAATRAGQNYLDVEDGSEFEDEDYIVVDPGGPNEQYYRIYALDSSMPNRLQFGRLDTGSSSRDFGASDLRYAPWVRTALPAGTVVLPVELSKRTLGDDYTVDAANGQIMIAENSEWGEGNSILISAVTDFVLPPHYRNGYTRQTNQDGSEGSWTGLPIQSGTYGVSVGGSVTFSVVPPRTLGTGDDGTSYNAPSVISEGGEFLVGSASTLGTYPPVLLSSADNCDDCHAVPGQTMVFHGRRAGAKYCWTCHGTARFGSGSPVQGRRTMRQMIHGFHMGRNLTFPSVFENGAAEHLGFPMWPGGPKHCDKCHGNDSYMQPTERDHPDQLDLLVPYKKYATACLPCHDSTGARAHADIFTADTGYESCVACHGLGSVNHVELSHKNR